MHKMYLVKIYTFAIVWGVLVMNSFHVSNIFEFPLSYPNFSGVVTGIMVCSVLLLKDAVFSKSN